MNPRDPSNMVVMYGGVSEPGWERPQQREQEDWQEILKRWIPVDPLPTSEELDAPEKLRVSAMVESDGTLKLRVELDGRLIVETAGRGTVTIESEL